MPISRTATLIPWLLFDCKLLSFWCFRFYTVFINIYLLTFLFLQLFKVCWNSVTKDIHSAFVQSITHLMRRSTMNDRTLKMLFCCKLKLNLPQMEFKRVLFWNIDIKRTMKNEFVVETNFAHFKGVMLQFLPSNAFWTFEYKWRLKVKCNIHNKWLF